jgi:hypothetical protein
VVKLLGVLACITLTIVIIAIVYTVTPLVTKQAEATNSQQSNEDLIKQLEARIEALEHLHWQDYYAVNAVSHRVWERASSCSIQSRLASCYLSDPVLSAFVNEGNLRNYISQNISVYGKWDAKEVNPDQWEVTATLHTEDHTYGPFTWYIWESNGFIESIQWAQR